jgi:beta-galactosidase
MTAVGPSSGSGTIVTSTTWRTSTNYYRPLAAQNIALDVISANASLDGYKLVIAPALLMLNESRAARLRDFVGRGGHLVLTVRCGMKDDYNALPPLRQPGPLADVAGVEVEEYYALLEPVPVSGEWFTGTSRLWAERLKVRDEASTEVIARYGKSNGWLDGHAAVTVHSHGKGRAYFIGAYLDEVSQQSLLERIAAASGVQPVMETPAGVEAGKRVNAEGLEVFIMINHTRARQIVQLPWSAHEHLSGQSVRKAQYEKYEL